MSVLRATLLLVLGLTACSAQSRLTGSDGGPSPSDALVFDLPPIADGGPAGYALMFDGVKDYATAADGGFVPVGAPMTIEVWTNWALAAGTQDFLTLRTDLSSGIEVGLHNGTLGAWRVYVDRLVVQAPTTPDDAAWHHVAYTFDGTTHMLYLDGTMVDSEMVAADDRTPTSVWLGTMDGSSNLFKGQMDEVRVWTVARTGAQVATDMHHSPPGMQPGLVAYWTFDDAINGGRSVDFSGTGNDVTLGDGVADYMPSRVSSLAPVGN